MNHPFLHVLGLFVMGVFSAPLHAFDTNNSSNSDTLTFGDPASENSHAFSSSNSETLIAGLGETARHLLPPANDSKTPWAGGTMSFTLTVDPERENYVTARFWGDEVTGNRMLLFADGKQIGYRHLGDVDQLDFGNEDPVYNGRFYYITTPIPLSLTKGKRSVSFELRSYGPLWPYGTTFEQWQKPMITPTRGTYKVYTHTDGYFIPPADEKQGVTPTNLPIRSAPGAEVLDQVKARVNKEIMAELKAPLPPNQMQMELLSRAWSVAWSSAYHNPAVVVKMVSGLDTLSVAVIKNPALAFSDPVTPNPDWFGVGLAAQALVLMEQPLAPQLEEKMDDGEGGKILRRDAYARMFLSSRDWHCKHRRLYTNQTIINDLYGIYLCNRALAVIAPDQALPPSKVMRYLDESVGLARWSDSDTGGSGPQERTTKNWNVGNDYWEITQKGLTKELGFVGNYGEVIDWVTAVYEATRPMPWDLSQPGDPKIREQLLKIARARSVFRYPMQDAQGNRAMRMETVIGWRDAHLPGDVVYGQRATWDDNTLGAAASTLDPTLMGFAHQMLDDNQYFASLARQLEQPGLRSTIGMLTAPDDYKQVVNFSGNTKTVLPMTPGQPDFVWTDEEDGVVALKHGGEIFYTSLYWRARYAINFLARVHYLTPTFSRIAVVREQTEFTPSGLIYKRPNWTNMAYANGGLNYNDGAVSAHAGEDLPVAKIPGSIQFKLGDENPYAGKGDFYTLRYGPFLIGMNMSKERDFTLSVPPEMDGATDLVSGKKYHAGDKIRIGPRSTVVLHFGK